MLGFIGINIKLLSWIHFSAMNYLELMLEIISQIILFTVNQHNIMQILIHNVNCHITWDKFYDCLIMTSNNCVYCTMQCVINRVINKRTKFGPTGYVTKCKISKIRTISINNILTKVI